jgi:hypothetical protein
VALAATAVAAPFAQANTGQSPDDRAFYRGGPLAIATPSLSPDDRAFYRGRSQATATPSLSPDDRAFYRGTPELLVSTTRTVSATPDGFHWADAAIGAAFGLVVALFSLGSIQVASRRRAVAPV